MKIFFSYSNKNITKHAKTYTKIKEFTKKLNHSLICDRLADDIKSKTKRPIVDPDIISAILAADMIIMDTTVDDDPRLGFQLAYGLEKEKPILLLSQKPYGEIIKMFDSKIETPLVEIESYTEDSLEKILTDHLDYRKNRARIRFNLVMDKKQDNYIEWAAYNKNTNKTDVIKKAIEKMMQTDDSYKKYLLKD